MAKRIISEATYNEMFGDFKPSCDSGITNNVVSSRKEFLTELETYFEYDESLEDYHAKRGYYFAE